MRLPRRSLLVAALAAALVVPATAQALPTVSMPDASTILVRSTTADEANHMVTELDGADLWIEETLAPGIEVEAPCVHWTAAVAVCPAEDVERIRMELGPGDDVVEVPDDTIRRELFGQDGGDLLEGGQGDDLLDGGPGVDQLRGMGGNDRLNLEDGLRDGISECGSGDDDVDTDLLLGSAITEQANGDCEVFAPEVGPVQAVQAQRPTAQPWQVGGWLRSTQPAISPRAIPLYHWHRCTPAGACAPAGEPSPNRVHILSAADVGHALVVEVTVSNRLGTKSSRSAPTPVISAAPVPTRQPRDHSLERLARRVTAETALTKAVERVGAALTRTQVRRLLRGKAGRLLVRLGESGPLTVRWTIPARTARRLGVRTSSAVLVARGTAQVFKGWDARFTIRLTATGRRLLRRARRLETSAAATHVVRGLGTLQPKPVRTTLRR